MEAPPAEEFANSKTLKAFKDNEQLLFQMKTKENNIYISTEIRNSLIPKIYEGIASLKEIQENKYFLQFDSMKEIFEELVFKFLIEYPVMTEDNDNLILQIFLYSSKI